MSLTTPSRTGCWCSGQLDTFLLRVTESIAFDERRGFSPVAPSTLLYRFDLYIPTPLLSLSPTYSGDNSQWGREGGFLNSSGGITPSPLRRAANPLHACASSSASSELCDGSERAREVRRGCVCLHRQAKALIVNVACNYAHRVNGLRKPPFNWKMPTHFYPLLER